MAKVDHRELFSSAAVIMAESDWWRGYKNWRDEHGEKQPTHEKCLWVAVTDAWTRLTDGINDYDDEIGDYAYGLIASHDDTITDALHNAITVVDSRYDGVTLKDIFNWNDNMAGSKEQTVTVLRTAADLAEVSK